MKVKFRLSLKVQSCDIYLLMIGSYKKEEKHLILRISPEKKSYDIYVYF